MRGGADRAAAHIAQPRAGELECRTDDRHLCSRVRDGARVGDRLAWFAHRSGVPERAPRSPGGRATKRRVEALTDRLAAKPYESLEPDELDDLVASSIDAE